MHLVALVVSGALALSTPEFAFFEAGDDPCATCGDSGIVACAKHSSADFALEANALFCTFYAGCASCAGTGGVDCPSCETRADEDERADARRKVRATAVARFADYEKGLGRPLLGAASLRFNLVCELEPMKAQRKRRSRHELLHLYLDRLEEVHRAYRELFTLADSEITARSEVFLWTDKADHLRAGETFCSYTPVDPAYRRGLEAISSIWLDPQKMEDDEALHRNVVHHAVHGIMNVQEPLAYTGKLRMGWADEGLALWFEDRLLGAATGFCFYPEHELRGLRGGRWRPALARMLADGEPRDFEAFLGLDTVDMTREQHALGFALVDSLAAQDPALLDRLLRRLRARTPARDAFKEVYGLALDEVETRWRAWAAETYPRH